MDRYFRWSAWLIVSIDSIADYAQLWPWPVRPYKTRPTVKNTNKKEIYQVRGNTVYVPTYAEKMDKGCFFRQRK